MPLAYSDWYSDLHDNDQNWVVVPGSDLNLANSFPSTLPWMSDCVRTGSRRKGDYLIQEVLGGPWPTTAKACAIDHALWGDQDSILWADTCPISLPGVADLELVGNSSVSYAYSDHTGAPLLADSAHMVVNTIAYGIWLKPVEENLAERGVLPFPDPPDYGYPADSGVEWEADHTTVWKVEIADAAGNAFNPDPNSRYAVNYDKQPSFGAGTWGAWAKGYLPGNPILGVDTLIFASDPVAETAKTWHGVERPAVLTENYLTATYDFGVAAGPAEAFLGGPELTADRVASTGLIVKVYVRSPRFRFVYEVPYAPTPIRVLQRGKDGLVGSGTNVLRRGSMQGSLRTIGGQR